MFLGGAGIAVAARRAREPSLGVPAQPELSTRTDGARTDNAQSWEA